MMATIAAAAVLVRWAGLALIVPSIVACLLARRRRDAIGVVAIQLGVTAAWQLVLLTEARRTARTFVWHPSIEGRELSGA